ncbi:FAD-linked oxidase C-terminal domain-containing protein [Dankookia sp. P2]|uniref:FAD-linked oxidase C-terminal domain-containing protein n=1 Tax=Dankookia sp. P2 TaxID=3423955 RepID=UPI003D6760DE
MPATGNIHLSLHAPADWAGDRAAWVERAGEMEPLVNAIAVSLGGSFSAEHGIGQSRRQPPWPRTRTRSRWN